MNKETYEALKDIVNPLTYSEKTNDYSYFILNSNSVRSNLVQLKNWIDEVSKEYEYEYICGNCSRPHNNEIIAGISRCDRCKDL